jgi:hypothetical protein
VSLLLRFEQRNVDLLTGACRWLLVFGLLLVLARRRLILLRPFQHGVDSLRDACF